MFGIFIPSLYCKCSHIPGRGGGGYFQKIGGGVRYVSWNLTLLQTEICDFPHPISDLTLKSMPYFRPALVRPMLKAMFIRFY